MARHARTGFRGRLALLGVVATLAAALSGCTSPRIQVTSGEARVLRDVPGFLVALAPESRERPSALTETAREALLERVRDSLRAKGHPVDGDAEAPIRLELAVVEELVSRRTYTSDTDASGTRLVKRPEAVVALRALDADGVTVLWHCEARGQLAERGRPFGPGEEAVFDRLLDRALDRIPPRE